MKKLHIILTVALLLAGCTLEEMRESVPKIDSKSFSIEQAKDFFEKDFATAVTKASSDGRKQGKLHPGDFTPLWDKAVYSQNGATAAYDVSILTDRRITASRGNGTETETVRVYQKLVITQNTINGKMTAYIMSLIPEKDQGHFPKSFSSRKSYRGNYSGIVVYTTVDSGAIVRVQEYRNGELHRGVYLPAGNGSIVERCRKAAQILKGIRLTSKRLIMTKSGEDWDDLWDDDDYDGWNLDDFFDLGDGIYTDGDGNYYLDIDEDGDIDMVTIAPGIIEDEYTGEDPWPPTDEIDPEDGENGYEEEEEEMNDIEEEEEEESNQAIQIIPPTPLTEYIGKPEFYRKRAEDFSTRYNGREAPSYYLQYGEKYCIKFKGSTRHILSEQGKEWVDKTLVALQLKLNKLITDNPILELDETALKAAAFESHVDAYIESGVLYLPLKDKIEILLSVDWNDLSEEYGRQQVLEILQEQINHYRTHPEDLNSDASYLINNKEDIMFRIAIYISMQTQTDATRSSYPNLNEEYIFNLILGPLVEYYEENIPGFCLYNE